MTFPSPAAESEELGVRFRYVEGAVHDRGDSATNRAEAEAMVREAMSVLLQPRKKGEPEPDAWTIEVNHKSAHKKGAPGLFGFSPQAQKTVYIDNISITAN